MKKRYPFFLVFFTLMVPVYAEINDVWDLQADFQNNSNPGPWVDPGLVGGGAGRWEYFGNPDIYDNNVVANPSSECNEELPTSGIGWTYTPGSHLSLCKFNSANGSNTNYQIGDVGGHSSLGVRWTTDHNGFYEIVAGGYRARINKLGRSDTLYLKDQNDDEIASTQIEDTDDGSANAVYLQTQRVYLKANDVITVGISGQDWVGLIVTITEVAPDSNLTIASNPSEVTTVLPYVNVTQEWMSGIPLDIEAYPMVNCSNAVKYVFDYWEINSNAVVADDNDPITRVIISQSGNAQITAHYTTTQPDPTDCMPWDLWFDGTDDYVEITGYKGITGKSSRTISAWIRTTKAPGEIITWGDHSPGGKWIVRVNESGALRAEVQGGYIYGTTAINNNRCHHVAVVLDSDGTPDISEVSLYVDGQLETISGVADEPIDTATDQNVAIGVYTTLPSRYFEGFISDVRIYDRALSGPEIYQLTNDTEVTIGLVAHWPLDEFSFNIADDAVGSNDGIINSELIRAFDMLCASSVPTALKGDINLDKIVDLTDLDRLVEDWFMDDCLPPYYCMGADINEDTLVNLKDYSSVSKNWLAEIQKLHHMGYVVITHTGPDDGGDFGANTPGTSTSGIQEAIDYSIANNKDVYVLGTRIYFSGPIYFRPAKNWRFKGPGYGINFGYATGDFVVFDSLINCEIELGLLIAQGPGIENGNTLAMVRPQNPVDGEVVVRNSKILINAPVGGGSVWGEPPNEGEGTGLTLDPAYGPIEHNTFLMLEVNACEKGLELLNGSYPIRNNSFMSPFNHLTNNPVVVYSGTKNKFNLLIDAGGVDTPGIGCNIESADHNIFRIFPPGGGGPFGSNAIVFGPNSRDNIVFADGIGLASATNNSNYDTDKIIFPSTPGFAVVTPAPFPATGLYQRNETLCTVAVMITSAGNVSSWRIRDSLGNVRQINAGLRQGQEIYLEPGDEVLFNYSSTPQWRWRALER